MRVKNLHRIPGLNQEYATKLEHTGLCSLKDLAKASDLKSLSASSGILVDLLAQWRNFAQGYAAASQYWLKAGLMVVIIVTLVLVAIPSWFHRQARRLAIESQRALIHGTYFQGGVDLRNAITQYRKAISLNPNSFEAHYMLSHALQLVKGDVDDEVIAEFREAIFLNPDAFNLHSEFGQILDEKGQHGEAIAEYRKAVALMPNDADLVKDLTQALEKNGRYEEAIAEYRKAVALMPDNTDLLISLGDTLEKNGRYEEAIVEYRKVIALDNNFADAHFHLAEALEKLGRSSEAKLEFDEAYHPKPQLKSNPR